LVWSGNPRYKGDRGRSIALERLASLLSLPGVQFVGLQKEVRDGDIDALGLASNLLDLRSELHDFADTAAGIAPLALVIAVDTAVAPLAAALGKPTWLLLPFSPDWRWLLDRDDSPWYPTMRLFRQDARREWDEVIDRVAAALAALA